MHKTGYRSLSICELEPMFKFSAKNVSHLTLPSKPKRPVLLSYYMNGQTPLALDSLAAVSASTTSVDL